MILGLLISILALYRHFIIKVAGLNSIINEYFVGYYDYYGNGKQYGGYYDQRYADYYGDSRYSKAYYDEYYSGQYQQDK